MVLMCPEDIDRRLNWPIGRAQKMARKKALPHVILPDGSIRFEWPDVERHVVRVPAEGEDENASPRSCGT